MLLRTSFLLFIAAFALAGIATDVHADQRVALVIGNSDYRNVSRLPNPTNDAEAIGALFKKAGFDVVNLRRDLDVSEMRRTIGDFADAARNADIAVVYYAGHGMEVNGVNYLIPVDAKLQRDFDVEDEAISLDRVLRVLEPAKRLRLVILDACRDNPFARSMKRTVTTRAVGRGLAPVEPLSTDTLVAYAAKAGSVASDGSGANSPYTQALLNHLAQPGLDMRIAFGRIRDEVMRITSNRQEPFIYGSLGGTLVSLVPGGGDFAPGPSPSSDAAQAWTVAERSTDPAVLEAFIEYYGHTFYGAMARARLAELKRQQVAEENDRQMRTRYAALVSQGDTSANNRDYDRAIADYGEAIRLIPKYALAFSNRGVAYGKKSEYDRAISDFNEAIRLDPKLAFAFFNRGLAYGHKGDHDRAISDYDEAIRLDPKDAIAFYNRGLAYGRKGDHDRAIADYDEAIRLDPKYANAFGNRGNAYLNKGDNDRAIADYNEAIRLDPQFANAFCNRGLARQAKGDRNGGIAD